MFGSAARAGQQVNLVPVVSEEELYTHEKNA
jgi:hypothetical protein